MSDNIRIRTTPNGNDKYVNLKLEQKFDFIEILSLKISQDKAYENFCSDYGVIVGRVVVNNGFGVPNAKVSVFIPVTDEDKLNPEIYGLYPYETVNDKNIDGIRYNLLPKESDNQNDCYTPVGTFPAKREILDNDQMLDVYCKYYKFTTTTNHAGDFMIFGVPLGTYVVHVDADISNIGIISQRPYDLIEQGTPTKFFYSPTKFKAGKNLNSLVQIKSFNSAVNVLPFWGNKDTCEIGINRLDFDLNYSVRPSAMFMGSIFGDSTKNSVNKRCRPRKDIGKLCQQVSREGTIEMIRKTVDNQIEQFDVEGGRVIDSDGTWAYQVPMNLDYVVTDEFGNLIPSDDENRGIPTRARVRFRVSMDEGGGSGRLRTRGKYLIPHNPDSLDGLDFNFDKTTKDESFTDLYWNKVYTVKNFISRTEKSEARNKTKNYTGIKDVDGCVGDKTPFPYNRVFTKSNILFTIICFILTLIASIVSALNAFLCWLRGIKIAGWRPFKKVKPIPMKCPSDPETVWYPGCGNTVSQYTDCVSAVLAEQLGLFQFDFYNDWVNGSLYYYLLKYKKKKRGKEKFCETNCTDYQGGTGHNPCRSNELVDTTVTDEDNHFSHKFRNGLMVKYGKTLYYPPILLDGSNMKLFATDVVNLGGVFDCDWQGFPKIVEYLTSTSYNIPPLIQELDEEDNSIVTGMIEIGNLYKGLFFDINCSGISFDGRQAANIRRQSELNVDNPETENGAPHATVSIQEIYDPTDQIDSATSINRYVRDSFYLLNINGSDIQTLPINNQLLTPSQGTSFEYAGNTQSVTHNNGAAYNAFRNYHVQNGNAPTDMSFQSWGNSYYMYFGLIPGKTALDKLISKYFTNCIKEVSDDFIVETSVTNVTTENGSDGIINFTFIGGTGPFTYTWIGPNYNYGPYTATTSGVISNLEIGDYTITATDALGTTVIKEVSVEGPLSLTCGFSIANSPTTQTSNDGKVNITQLYGGIPPYTLVVTGPNTNVTYNNVSITNSPIGNLGVGQYIFTVSDSSQTPQTCSQTLNMVSASALVLDSPIIVQNISCGGGDCDGIIDPRVSGGVPPYMVSVIGPNGYSNSGVYGNVVFDSLCVGGYIITVSDSINQSVTGIVTLTQSIQPTINVNGINNRKQCDPTKYTVKFNIVQGTLPSPYTIRYSVDGVDYTQTGNNGLNTIVITENITDELLIVVEDSEGCESNELSYSSAELQKPTLALTLGGTRLSNTITYSASGGFSPYTYTPVNVGQINVYTAPNANPVIGIVTDNVGCTASNSF
jgi:hypothetical protein